MIEREVLWPKVIPEYYAQRAHQHLGFDVFDFRDWLYQTYGLYPYERNLWAFEKPEDETLFLLKYT